MFISRNFIFLYDKLASVTDSLDFPIKTSIVNDNKSFHKVYSWSKFILGSYYWFKHFTRLYTNSILLIPANLNLLKNIQKRKL